MSDSTSIAKSSAVMAGGTLASRVLGLLRQLLTAAVVGGTGLVADAWTVGNALPNIFHLLLAGGVLNAVIVPQITGAMRRDDGEVFVNRLLTIAITAMAVATVVLTLAAPFLVWLSIDSSWGPGPRGLAVAFAFICLPQMFFYGLYTLLGQVLTANSRFGMFMWAPAVANVVAIAGLGWLLLQGNSTVQDVDAWTPTMIAILAGSATLSIACQAIVLIPSLRAIGFRFRPVWGIRGSGLGSASRVAMWAFGAVAIGQLGYFVTSRVLTGATDEAAAQGIAAAGMFAYTYAFLLFMLPHSIVTVSFVTAIFTRLSHSVHDEDTAAVTADLRRGMRLPAVILIPGTAAMILAAPYLLQVVLPGNPLEVTNAAVGVFVAMTVGLVPYGWFFLVQRAYYAYEDGRTPFGLQLVVTGVAVAFTLFASTVAATQSATWVGVGQSVSNLLGAVIGLFLLRRRVGNLGLTSVVGQNARLVLGAVVGVVLAWLALQGLEPLLPVTWTFAVVRCAVIGTVVLLVTLGIGAALRVQEVTELLQPIIRRLSRG